MGAVERGGRSALTATWSTPDLRRLYAAEVVSGAGDGIFWVSLVVYLGSQPEVGLWLALAAVARLAPRTVLSLPAGTLVDRADLRRLLVAVDGVRAGIMAAAAALVAAGVHPGGVLVVVFLSYAVGAPTRPGLAAAMPSVAGEAHLAAANAVLSTIRQTMTVIGPVLGVAVLLASPAWGFVANAVTFGVSALLLAGAATIPRHRAHPTVAGPGGATRPWWRRVLAPVTEATAAARGIPSMTPLLYLVGLVYVVRGAELVLHVYVATELLGQSEAVVGLLGGAMGLGALLAMPLATAATGWARPWRPVLASVVLTAVPTAALALVDRTVTACLVLVPVGVGMVLFEVVVVVLVQRVAPPAVLGRIFGGINAASNGGKLLGAVLSPLLVTWVGVGGSLVVVAGVTLVAGVVLARELVPLGRSADRRRDELAPVVAVLADLAVFEGAPVAALERLAAAVVEESRSAGDVVLRQGDPADDLFVARSGALEVEVDGHVVNRMGPGDWFGEIGLVERRRRTATVVAASDVDLWRIPGTAFLGVLEDGGAAPSALVDGIADRLSRAPARSHAR